MASASIQFSHISKVFMSGTEAVKNFNLDIEDGEICGDCRLFRLRKVHRATHGGGAEEITSGELRIDGKVVNELDPKKRNIAMVFQKLRAVSQSDG